jgi:hypothetical protein
MSSKKQGGRFHKGIASYRVAEGLESSAITEFLSALDCPRSLAVLILFRNGEHEQIAKMEFNPKAYNSLVDLRSAYAATKFLSKFEGLSFGIDLDEVALKKFDSFELLCKQTNHRFGDLSRDPLFKGRAVWLHNAVIRKIDKILGDFSADEIFARPDWGPGASTLIKRREASPAKKFRCETGITRDLYDLIPWETLEKFYPSWANQLVEAGFPSFQVGNKVITVPKDASTNRVIAVEPGINMWFQKAIGDMVERRLQRYGIDLRWQSRNQSLARIGSETQSLATIDLSSASDSISAAVVEVLLPRRWWLMMDSCRSHYGSRSGSQVKWEKFSSMGNGFTFQLETLIFYAIATCCADYLSLSASQVSAYGDDVIIPTACYDVFAEMMSFYGFQINVKKSHFDSPFRESCGAHYYSGIDVKPIYLKGRVDSIPAIYRLANASRRLAHRRNFGYGCDLAFKRLFDLLVSSVPEALRFRITEELGDGGFISNFDEASPSRARKGLGVGYQPAPFVVPNVVEVSKTHFDDTVGYLLAALWKLESIPDSSDANRRKTLASAILHSRRTGDDEGRTRLQAIGVPSGRSHVLGYNSVPAHGATRFRVVNSLVQRWYDLGPWF